MLNNLIKVIANINRKINSNIKILSNGILLLTTSLLRFLLPKLNLGVLTNSPPLEINPVITLKLIRTVRESPKNRKIGISNKSNKDLFDFIIAEA